MHRNRNNLKVAVNLDAYYYPVRFIAILPHIHVTELTEQTWQQTERKYNTIIYLVKSITDK